MMTGLNDHTRDGAFWRFSVRFYAKADVAAACLALQDEAGVDVNLLLFALFLAQRRLRIGVDDVARLDRGVAAWRDDMVKPLRALRRRLKQDDSHDAHLLHLVGQAERKAERAEQYRLEAAASGLAFQTETDCARAARANLAVLGAYQGGLPQAPIQTILSAFTAGCSPL